MSALGWAAGGRREDVRVRVLGRPGCHLCEDAVAVVSQVCADLGVGWDELDVSGDPALLDRYAEEVPVVLVDGEVLGYWRVSPDRLRAALLVT
ncbi:MAG TPA: glutaredoxin family protein [Actinomycetes bacterium]|nr:glutaredoxin family protein [Actinomycetes bacterium]